MSAGAEAGRAFEPSLVRQVLAVAGITLRDGLRRRAAWACALLFLGLSALGSVPFSPGVPAAADLYRGAGLATLLLGGWLLSLLVLPALCAPGRRGGREQLLALPLARGVLPAGFFLGFALLLLAYHAAGGGALVLVARWTDPAAGAAGPLLLGALLSWCAALPAAAVVLCAVQRMAYAAAVAAFGLWLLLAHAADVLPGPVRIFFPAPAALDPASLSAAPPGAAAAAVLHLAAYTGACLAAAALLAPRVPEAE